MPGERLSLLENDVQRHTHINESIASSGRDSVTLKVIELEDMQINKQPIDEGVIDFNDEEIPPLDLLEAIGADKADYTKDEINPILEKIFHGEQNHITVDKGLLVAFPVLTITAITVFRGSRTLKSLIGVERWNAVDFALFGAEVSILIIFSFICLFLLKKEYKKRRLAGYKFVRGDIEWNESHMMVFER